MTGIDAAQRSQDRQHVMITELVRDIPVSAGAILYMYTCKYVYVCI